MLRLVMGGFVLAHGVVTAAIWVAPKAPDTPFEPAHSWLLGDSRRLSALLAAAAGVGLVLTGVGVLADQGWWAGLGAASATLAIVLMLLYFNHWLVLGIAISASILYASLQAMQEP